MIWRNLRNRVRQLLQIDMTVDENNKLCGDVDFEDVKDKVYTRDLYGRD